MVRIYRFPSGKRGFTLIELMVVIGIIALLAAIMVPNFAKRVRWSKMVKAEADIANIETAIAMYETDLGVYPAGSPDSTNEIDALDTWLTGRDGGKVISNLPSDWRGPYSKNVPKDPWGNRYVYLYNTDPTGTPAPDKDYPASGKGGSVDAPKNMDYYIYSKGRDGQTGTGYNKDDINNWDVNKSWRTSGSY